MVKKIIFTWLYAAIFTGLVWGVYKRGILPGIIFGISLLIFGLGYEIYRSRKK
jgi:hypothetical protein